MSILIAAAVGFSAGHSEVNGRLDLASQLTPVLGEWSRGFIAFGFLAAGLSSSVTAPLAASFATSEVFGWKNDLTGKNFRAVWIFVLLSGLVFSSLGIKPTVLILFSQVANALLLPIVASFLVWIINDRQIMGNHANTRTTNVLALGVILITVLLGARGIINAIGPY